MTSRARFVRLAAAPVALLVFATGCGCGGAAESASSATDDTASADPGDSPTSAAPSAEPIEVPFDRSVLTRRAPASTTQPIKVVNGAAKGTVIAVRPVPVEPAASADLAGLSGKDLAAVKGKKAYFLTYEVSYVNGTTDYAMPDVRPVWPIR